MENEKTQVELAKQNPRDFKPLYQKYFNDVFRFVLSHTGNIEITKDLVSEIFCKILQALPQYTYQSPGGFKSWMLKIAYTTTMQFFRTQHKEPELTVDQEDFNRFVRQVAEEHPVNDNNREQLTQYLMAELNRLNTDDLQLLELRFFENLSYADIAQITGKTETNVKTKTFRILKKLKSSILQKTTNNG